MRCSSAVASVGPSLVAATVISLVRILPICNAVISGGFSTKPPERLKSVWCNCTGVSFWLMLRATDCAPHSQHGNGDMLLPGRGESKPGLSSGGGAKRLGSESRRHSPENLRPKGKSRSKRVVVRRCRPPTSDGGSAARRAIACAASCSPLNPPRRVRVFKACCKSSIKWRSLWSMPISNRSLSSLIDEICSGQRGGSSPVKTATGTERRVRKLA
eukprot:7384796-Prymnesium_polylepis.3